VEVEQDIFGVATWIAKHSRESAWRFFDAVDAVHRVAQIHARQGQPKTIPRKTTRGHAKLGGKRLSEVSHLLSSSFGSRVRVRRGARLTPVPLFAGEAIQVARPDHRLRFPISPSRGKHSPREQFELSNCFECRRR
jgi:hypothetical protein